MERRHEPLPGPGWFGTGGKIADIGAARVVQMILGNVLRLSGTVIHEILLRLSREGELRRSLIERGAPPAAARRAVRDGRGEALAARHGLRPADGLGTWDDPTGAHAGAHDAGPARARHR